MVIRYTNDDFNKIIRAGINTQLSESTINLIKQLTEKVGNPDYVRTPQFSKQSSKETNNSGEWEAVRKFKVTQFKKSEGIDSSIDSIRKHLNKMTKTTYDKLSKKIIDEINAIVEKKNLDTESIKNDVEMKKIGETIYNIASTSAFFSELYAKFYITLMENFPFMKEIFNSNFISFSKIFHEIDYCNPNKDYDKFCENNKNNEKRRALGLFFINLMLFDALSKESVINIIITIQNYIINEMKNEEMGSIIDELSELVFIMMSTIIKHDKDIIRAGEWFDIIENITMISKLKSVSYPSITNKAIFKHLDVVDLINK